MDGCHPGLLDERDAEQIVPVCITNANVFHAPAVFDVECYSAIMRLSFSEQDPPEPLPRYSTQQLCIILNCCAGFAAYPLFFDFLIGLSELPSVIQMLSRHFD